MPSETKTCHRCGTVLELPAEAPGEWSQEKPGVWHDVYRCCEVLHFQRDGVRLVAVAHLRAIGEAAQALGQVAIPGMVERAIAEVRAEANKAKAVAVKGQDDGAR